MEEIKLFKYATRSLDEFAVLLALGASVVGVDRISDPKFYRFILESHEIDLEKKVLEFASKTLSVNAYDLCDAMRRAKSVVHTKVERSF